MCPSGLLLEMTAPPSSHWKETCPSLGSLRLQHGLFALWVEVSCTNTKPTSWTWQKLSSVSFLLEAADTKRLFLTKMSKIDQQNEACFWGVGLPLCLGCMSLHQMTSVLSQCELHLSWKPKTYMGFELCFQYYFGYWAQRKRLNFSISGPACLELSAAFFFWIKAFSMDQFSWAQLCMVM